jgi:hypothetical protein
MSMAQANGENRNGEQPRDIGGILRLTFAILGGPVIWISHFNFMYFLVQPVCRLGGEAWFHVASVVALIGIIAAGVIAWRIGQQFSGGFRAALEGEGNWKGFVGVYGVASAVLFFYAVVYTWSPVFTSLDPCTGL